MMYIYLQIAGPVKINAALRYTDLVWRCIRVPFIHYVESPCILEIIQQRKANVRAHQMEKKATFS